jgi:hypothetical protein
MGPHSRLDAVEPGRAGWVVREDDGAAAADAVAERAQPVGGGGAVPGKPAALAAGGRLELLGQRAFNVPSR